MIVVGLDGGMNKGAAVALDSSGEVLAFEAWAPPPSHNKHMAVASAAKRLRMQLPGTETIALAAETVYVRIHGRRTNDLKQAKELATKGWVELRGSPGDAAISIAKSVGIWIGYFPEYVFDIAPSEWRKIVGIPNTRTIDLKGEAIALAIGKLEGAGNHLAEQVRSCVAAGNDHLAEAYHIATAGLKIAALVVEKK